MGIIRGHDPKTLRELIDPAECEARLEELGAQRSLPALLERTWLLKVLGNFDEALAVSEQSVRTARMAGTRRDLIRARTLHASVVHSIGDYASAELELSMCVEEAAGHEWPSIAAFAAQHLGRVHFDNENFHDARAAFKQALFYRQQSGASDDELAATLHAIDMSDQLHTESLSSVN